jgi:hypothetical protein
MYCDNDPGSFPIFWRIEQTLGVLNTAHLIVYPFPTTAASGHFTWVKLSSEFWLWLTKHVRSKDCMTWNGFQKQTVAWVTLFGPKLILISAQSFVNLRRTLQISVGSQWTSCLLLMLLMLLMLLLLGPYNFDVIRKIDENSGFEGGHLPFWSYPITSTMQCLVFVYCLENFWNVLGSPNMFQRRLHPLMALSQNCLSQSLSSENHFRQWNCATLG